MGKKLCSRVLEPNNIILRLMEEVGELARETNHRFGEKPPKNTDEHREIAKEIADVLFTLIYLVNYLDIDLEGPLEM